MNQRLLPRCAHAQDINVSTLRISEFLSCFLNRTQFLKQYFQYLISAYQKTKISRSIHLAEAVQERVTGLTYWL
jgi:hypothetical protein